MILQCVLSRNKAEILIAWFKIQLLEAQNFNYVLSSISLPISVQMAWHDMALLTDRKSVV